MYVLALSSSPRKNGNTEILLDAVISGLNGEGAKTDIFRLHDMNIAPCTGCGTCERELRCSIEDDFRDFIEPLTCCDGVIFASPLYFMNVPAGGKAFIDRCQFFWSAKYRHGKNLFGDRRRYGLLVSCGGADSGIGGTPLFRGIADTMAVLFDALGLEMMDSIIVPGIERKGEISKNADILEKARERGRMMAKLVIRE